MFSKLLIALRLKKPQPKPSLAEALMPRRYVGHVPPRPMPPPAAPRRMYSAPAVAPTPAPAPSDDFASNLLLYPMLNSRSEPAQCKRDPEPEPFRAGGGGDFGGGGATGSWEPPAPSPAYEPPAPSPSYESSSSSSDSYSSSSSDSSSSSSTSSD